MSKTIVGLVLFGAAATVSVAAPVVLLVNNNDGSGKRNKKFEEPTWNGKKIELTHSKDIKSKYTNIDCLKEYFNSEVDWDKVDSQSNDEPSLNSIPTDSSNLKGCLLVEYYKQPHDEMKWWGSFRLIWALSNDKEGLVTVFNSDAKDGSFKFDSSVYIIEKGSDDKWISKYRYEKQEREVATNEGDLLKKFPQASNSMFIATGQDYWGFSPVANKVCGVYECTMSNLDPNKTEQPLRWDLQKNTGGSDTVSGWCKNFNDWFGSLFPQGKNTTLKTQLAKLKGKWPKQPQQ